MDSKQVNDIPQLSQKKKLAGSCCSAFVFSRQFKKVDNVRFHSYPLKAEQRLKKWLVAIKREGFKPTHSSQICGDHFLHSDYHLGSRERKRK